MSDLIVVGGGDGTFSTLLAELAALNLTIGILPLGTGNHLASELGLIESLRWDDAAQIVKFCTSAR